MGEEAVREIRCRVTDLRYKDVISVEDGCRLGYVSDVEIDTCSARVLALVIVGKQKFLGLFGKCEEYIIIWKDIVIIGEDAILVRFCRPNREPKPPKKAFFENFFQ